MIAGIFEVKPSKDGFEIYLDHAAQLKPLLTKLDGFISIERFQSLANPNKLVSLSFWRDEEAVLAWREQPEHRETQRAGRDGMLIDYRLRVATVVRDYGLMEREQAPPFHPPVPAPPTPHDEPASSESWLPSFTGTLRRMGQYNEVGIFTGNVGTLGFPGRVSQSPQTGLRLLEHHGLLTKFSLGLIAAMATLALNPGA